MGGVLVYTLNKTSPPIFHWAQAVPTRCWDRSYGTAEIWANLLGHSSVDAYHTRII